mmetsp:Transcript_18807/g.54386  ORF Transcript_18807/g.54386 Transcript_18807/m.54386 type:complete len:206 (+) Transcript_18807:1034-1651(+)
MVIPTAWEQCPHDVLQSELLRNQAGAALTSPDCSSPRHQAKAVGALAVRCKNDLGNVLVIWKLAERESSLDLQNQLLCPHHRAIGLDLNGASKRLGALPHEVVDVNVGLPYAAQDLGARECHLVHATAIVGIVERQPDVAPPRPHKTRGCDDPGLLVDLAQALQLELHLDDGGAITLAARALAGVVAGRVHALPHKLGGRRWPGA